MDDFVALPRFIYKNNPYYVPDMDSDIRDMFNPDKNPGLKHSRIQAFVAYDENGTTVGRVAGIINDLANSTWNKKAVRFGMIEFIDDLTLSSALVKVVANWGREAGMNYIEGPMGITDFDKEGMLMSDFNEKASFITIYNQEYYPQHMQKLGFEGAADWVQVKFDVPKEIPERFQRVSRFVREKYGLTVRKANKHQITKEGLGIKIFDLFNKAYQPLFGFSKLSEKQQQMLIDKFLPLMDLRLIPLIFNKDNTLVGAAITLGSLTDALQKSKGRLMPFGWFHLLKALKFKHSEKVEMILIAVDPELQGKGVNALFFEDLIPVMNKLHYT